MALATASTSFQSFYYEHFLPEHRHPHNIALHVLGTLLGLVWLPVSLLSAWPWLVVLFPLVHAAPGLIGHRLFERNERVGDLRVLRTDFPKSWFIAANHRLACDVLRGRLEHR
jgi:hypothetical protein